MVTMSDYPVSVDGVVLDTLAHGVEAQSWNVGALRTGDVVIPGVTGVQASVGDAREPAGFTLSMFVRGTDEDGFVPAGRDAQAQVRENLANLLHLFTRTDSLVDVRETVSATGETWERQRQALCKAVDAIGVEVLTGAVARFTVALMIPEGAWRDAVARDWTQVPVQANSVYEVTTLRGSSAPVEDAVIMLEGPANFPRIVDVASGNSVRLNRSLLAGERWRIDSATWGSTTGSGFSAVAFGAGGFGSGPFGGGMEAGTTLGSAGGIDRVAVTEQAGMSPRLLTLTPRLIDGQRRVRLQVQATGMSQATTLSVRARRAHVI